MAPAPLHSTSTGKVMHLRWFSVRGPLWPAQSSRSGPASGLALGLMWSCIRPVSSAYVPLWTRVSQVIERLGSSPMMSSSVFSLSF